MPDASIRLKVGKYPASQDYLLATLAGHVIANVDCDATPGENREWSERLAASYNACAGLPLAALKDGLIADLIAVVNAYRDLDERVTSCEHHDLAEAAETCYLCFPAADDARCRMRATIAKLRGTETETPMETPNAV